MPARAPQFRIPRPLATVRPDIRETSHQRGYGSAWRQARLAFLQSHPLCVQCASTARVTAASVVDHITPHKGNMALFWDTANWQPLCKPCHSRKTAKKDGGFGNPTAVLG